MNKGYKRVRYQFLSIGDFNLKILYLYGFASGPQSVKAQFFKEKFTKVYKGIDFEIFDYIPDKTHFTNMETSQLLKNLSSHIELNNKEKIVLFGSSFGGLIALWYTSINPSRISKLILIAPALKFSADFMVKTLDTKVLLWEKHQFIFVDHYRYNQAIPLNYSFYEDLKANPPPNFNKVSFPVPILIFHGKKDDVVPIAWSCEFKKSSDFVKLIELESDHQLLDQKETIWKEIRLFLGLK